MKQELTYRLVLGMEALVDARIFTEKGVFINSPSGEAYIAPLEGTAEGKVVVEVGWFQDLTELMILVFKN